MQPWSGLRYIKATARGNPMLGDHLEQGLEIFGISSEGM
jgi:hypothetical protein